MINILDKDKYGLMLWGTKLGAQVFAKHNMTHDEIRPFIDITGQNFKFDTSESILFGYEYKQGYHSYSIFKSIRDWSERGRTGYFAITLYVSNAKLAPTAKIASLLKQLADLYEKEYIDKRDNKIYENIKEDVSLFYNIVNQNEYNLRDETNNQEQEQYIRGYVTFEGQDNLDKIFTNLHPSEEPDLSLLWILEKNQVTLPAETSIKQLLLPTYPKTFKLNVKVYIGGSPLPNQSFKVNISNKIENNYETDNLGCFDISDLSERDTIQFILQPSSYEWSDISQGNIFRLIEKKYNEVYSVELDLKKKPEFTNVNILFPDLINETNQNVELIDSNEKFVLSNGKLVLNKKIVGEQFTVRYPGTSKYYEKSQSFLPTKTEHNFSFVLLKVPQKEKIEIICSEKLIVRNKDGVIKQYDSNGRTYFDAFLTENLSISFSGSKKFEKQDFPNAQSKIKNNTLKIELKEKIKLIKPVKTVKTVKTVGTGDKGWNLKSKLIIGGLLFLVLSLLVVLIILIMDISGAFESKNNTDNNPLKELTQKIEKINKPDWAFSQKEDKAIQEELKKLCKKEIDKNNCNELEEELRNAIIKAKFRSNAERQFNTKDKSKEELEKLKKTLLSKEDSFQIAFGNLNKYKELKAKFGEDEKDSEPSEDIDEAYNSIIKDAKFSQEVKAKELLKTINDTNKKKALENYILGCKHVAKKAEFSQCLNALSSTEINKVTNDFECSGTKISAFRKESTDIRTRFTPEQQKFIKQQWEDLLIEMQKKNPNYKS